MDDNFTSINETRRHLGMQAKAKMSPQCPYCGNVAPHGDERYTWMSIHLDSRLHRLWWKIRKVI